MQAGGPVNLIDRRPDCSAAVGWGRGSEAPSVRVNWGGGSEALLRFYFMIDEAEVVEGPAWTHYNPLLVVRDPAGNWMCNDDYAWPDKFSPILEYMHPEAGTYHIWVNSMEGNFIDGTLYITQIPGNHP